jgi:hypothetical protein
MASQTIHLEGTVTDRIGGAAVPAVLVEAWDAEEKFGEIVASAFSDPGGKFVLAADRALLEKAFAGRSPKVTLKLTIKGTRVAFKASDQEVLFAESQKPVALSIKVPQVYGGDNLFMHLPANLRAELDELKKHGTVVLERLKDEKARQAFLTNPAQALAAMGVPLSPQLRQRLSAQLPPKNLATPRAFRLLNGQIVTPKIRINFTDGTNGKGASHGR